MIHILFSYDFSCYNVFEKPPWGKIIKYTLMYEFFSPIHTKLQFKIHRINQAQIQEKTWPVY